MKFQVLSLKSKVGSRARAVGARGFTMIEIALCLAIIGFALVAIIGIMPTSMQTQKNNRQETVINQDATVFLDAIRNGAQGMDELTNYVVAITNSATTYINNNPQKPVGMRWYTYTGSSTGLPLTNGFNIVGLLSTPKYIPLPQTKAQGFSFISNHVVAYVRSMSGPASEKTPLSSTPGINPVQDMGFNLGFNYRLIADVVPYFGYNTNGFQDAVGAPTMPAPGTNQSSIAFSQNLQANLHDVRLTFKWPLLPDGSTGSGYQVFRASATGTLVWTNFAGQAFSWPTNLTSIPPSYWPTMLFFIQPRTYSQVTP